MTDALATNAEVATYAGVEFPVTEVKNESGHRQYPHEAYGRDGADVEPGGRRPYKCTLVCPLVNASGLVARFGELYPTKWVELLAMLESTPRAVLNHPTRGRFTAAILAWRWQDNPRMRNGVVLEIDVMEHRGTVASPVGIGGGTSTTDPMTAASAQASAADAAAIQAGVSAYQPTVPVFDLQLAALLSGVLTYAQTVAAVAAMLSIVSDNLLLLDTVAFDVTSAVNLYAAQSALEGLRGMVFFLQSIYLPVLARRYVTPRKMALWEVAQAVYGDLSGANLIGAANVLSDYQAIPQGTVLICPPQPG